MTRTSIRPHSLFELYSADLARFGPKDADGFVCPLCHRLFKRTPKLGDGVTVEHVVPKRLGGRVTTLTCRDCNSNHGTTLDAHLVRRVRIESGEQAVSARVRIGAGEHGAEMRVPELLKDETIKIVGIPKQSHPDRAEAAVRALKEGERTIHLKLNFGYVHLRSSVALLRAAYLLMFRVFGYRYIFDRSAEPILHQIQNPIEQTSVLKGIMWRVNEPLPMEHCVSIVTKPEHLRSFVVFLQLDAATKHVAGVMLPAPGTDGSAIYGSMQSPDARGTRSMKCIPLPHECFWPFREVWEHVSKTKTE